MVEAIAKEVFESYKNNKVIREFVESEAFEKTAEDIRNHTGSGATSKAVKAMYANKNSAVVERVSHYIATGYTGVYMAQMELTNN